MGWLIEGSLGPGPRFLVQVEAGWSVRQPWRLYAVGGAGGSVVWRPECVRRSGRGCRTMLLCLSSGGLGEPVVVADGEVVVVAGASFEF